MNFIDKTKVSIRAGAGGDGKLSFRQEKFVDKGGPDGGDGGHGADVVLVASRNQNTLVAFRYQKELVAESGQSGGINNRHGRSGKELLVQVPVGTVVTRLQPEAAGTSDNPAEPEILADLTADGQQAVIARGGKGGFGNAHFTSSRRQAPRFAEKGEAGDDLEAMLELKVIADVGLVGLPNAGKSTLLARISNARPEIADYPFTTLRPNLGVVDIDKTSSLLFADIPGLIEGAAQGKGLGHEFLRHIERTAMLLHLIDAYQDDIVSAYQTIQDELTAYKISGGSLANKPQMVVLNKIDGLDDDIVQDLIAQLRQVVPASVAVMAISAAAGSGLQTMLYEVRKMVEVRREAAAAAAADNEFDGLPILRLSGDEGDRWEVMRDDDIFVVRGRKIEQFAARTDFSNDEAVQRLRAIMRKNGIMKALIKQGIEADQLIRIGDVEGHTISY